MIDNPIVDEIRQIREQILARYGGDLQSLIQDAQRRTQEAARAGRQVASLPPPGSVAQPIPTKKVG